MSSTDGQKPDDRMLRRVVAGATVGTALEWYDFFIYGTAAALVFGDLLVFAEGARLFEQAVHQRRLAMVDVRDDRDVADVHKSLFPRGFCKARLYARSVTAARRVEAASCRCHSPAMRKRSVTIDGHRTSVSLEDAFWAELSAIAEQRGLSLNALVAEIDHGRSPGNLSSALRLFVLDELRKRTISRV